MVEIKNSMSSGQCFIPKTLGHFYNCILVSSCLSFSTHIMEYLGELIYLCLRSSLDAVFFGEGFFEILIFSLIPNYLTPHASPPRPHILPETLCFLVT